MDDPFLEQRMAMVEQQIRARGVQSGQVLRAMAKVPRHLFVPEAERSHSYLNGPLPIGFAQTISQPYIVAYMTEALELGRADRVLEIGTGSGYQTAVLAEIAAEVCTVEIIPELGRAARELLTAACSYTNIRFRTGRGQDGWPEFAPFDRILLTAAPAQFPDGLFPQLAEGGIAIAPVGGTEQRLVRYRKRSGRIEASDMIGVIFVPLV
jgi:protein-L-isoaspartate(D-aspartate) O-methyltransferase